MIRPNAKRGAKRKHEFYIHHAQPVVTRQLTLTDDGRRVLVDSRKVHVERVSDPQHHDLGSTDSENPPDISMKTMSFGGYDDVPLGFSDGGEGLEDMDVVVVSPAPRYENSDVPLKTFTKYRERYLDEMLRLDGRGSSLQYDLCPQCNASEPTIRRTDCWNSSILCSACTIEKHVDLPLHQIEKWHGGYFQRTSLKEIGLRLQLGHGRYEHCSRRVPGHKDFTVIHVNGIHTVSVDFCGCQGGLIAEHWCQLLRTRWFPATPLEPQTCATFEVLRLFQTVNLQGHLAGYDFYKALEFMTDTTGLMKVQRRLPAFMNMVREWRHLKSLKRGGRGHSLTSIAGTQEGELAVQCRACPSPGINIPEKLENIPPATRFLYHLFLYMDANFRLQNRMRSSEEKDPALAPGWSYFNASEPYHEHLRKYVDQEEISTCAGFAALFLANLKSRKGVRVTGVGGVVCRHELWRPNGIGDLQKGERYCNMDYIFLSSITSAGSLPIVLSYDVMCQWLKNFWTRIESLPEHLRGRLQKGNFKGVIPKFHIVVHEELCQQLYSLHYTPGVGRTDGEGIERNWSVLNGAACSTKEMGPGTRRDTLDDFCGFSNYKKVLAFGNTLLRRMLQCIPEAVVQRRMFEEFQEGLREERPDQLREWEKMLVDWEDDHSKPCPYQDGNDAMTLSDVRLQLAQEDEARGIAGFSGGEETSASSFLLLGLDIERLQLNLYMDIKEKKKISTLQAATFSERRAGLRRKIQNFHQLQDVYMPALRRGLQDAAVLNVPADVLPESLTLFMPSDVDGSIRHHVCVDGLINIKMHIRRADASDALEELRRQLRTRTFLNRWKVNNVTGQRPNTRARGLQHANDLRVHAAKMRYRRSRECLLALLGSGDWEKVLRPLEDSDVRGLGEKAILAWEEEDMERLQPDVEQLNRVDAVRGAIGQLGEGRRALSWIWYSVSMAEDGDSCGMHEALRVEWAKAKARATRWSEELMLIEEEMRRVIEFCRWRAKWWDEQATVRMNSVDTQLLEGLTSYAAEQACVEHQRAAHLEGKWAPVRSRAKTALSQVNHQVSATQIVSAELSIEVEVDDDMEFEDEDE